MISVASPLLLGTAVAAAVVTTVLHFLSVRRPPTLALPTMRFLPERTVRAVSRSARPSDLWLLLLRVLALLLAGVGMAGVTWSNARVERGRVVVIDRSGSPENSASLRTRAGDVLQHNDTVNDTREFASTRVVLMDSVAQLLTTAEMRSFNPETLSTVRAVATLSTAILAGVRAAGAMVRNETKLDSLDLDIVSPLRASGEDAALASVRKMWPGRINLVEVAVNAGSDTGKRAVRLRFVGESPDAGVLSALPVANGIADRAKTSLAGSGNADHANANGSKAGRDNSSADNITRNMQDIAIEWPANGVPSGWTATKPDTIGALSAGGYAMVWPFVRTARVSAGSLHNARAIAWWSDGAIAAVERDSANGCTRQIAAIASPSSDALQGQSARALLSVLSAPCGLALSSELLSPAKRELIVGNGGAAAAAAFRLAEQRQTPFGSIMLLLALILLSIEWWIRDREGAKLKASRAETMPLRKVA